MAPMPFLSMPLWAVFQARVFISLEARGAVIIFSLMVPKFIAR